MFKMSRITYGGTAAAVTSTALVSGLSAAGATKTILVSGLLIAALADNLTDALSIHVYKESERIDEKDALTGTLTNFVTRLVGCLSFVLLVALFPLAHAAEAAIVWGIALLAPLNYLVARERNVNPMSEVFKHLLVAFGAIIVSNQIGHWVAAVLR